ncbi:MAG TPA: hypothetical protein VLL97_02905 [Acidobacteriota bacterium]|nr:hypothetical protein [Acidobacteriota bacterium]
MKRITFMLITAAGMLLASTVGFAQGNISCTRGGLQQAVKLYIEAQTKGDPSVLPLAKSVEYLENMAPHKLSDGIINKPMKIDHTLSIFDEYTCQTFTEVIVTDPKNPYVLGTRLRVNHDKVAELEILWTTTGYWLFDADNYLKYSKAEDWGPIPAEKRDTRGFLAFAANSYLDAFLEAKIDLVPWGFPCVRIEGGAYTGRGRPDDSCEVGVPAGVNITSRRFIIDDVLGAVAVYCRFGGGESGAPDTHLFRVENSKLRYVHTLTHLLQANFQGGKVDPPPIQ